MNKNEIAKDNYFGKIVEDPYRWLEDDNASEVKEWVKKENLKTENFLSKISCREKIKNRLEEIWNYEKRTSPFKAGDYYYFFKTDGLENQSIMYRQEGSSKAEEKPELFFDPNKLSDDGVVALKNIAFSKDGDKMVYSVSSSGSDWEDVFVFDTKTKTKMKDHLKWVKFSNLAWYKDGFFYNSYDISEEKKAFLTKDEFQKVKYHKLGTSQKDDIVIFEDKDHPFRIFSASTTKNEDFLFITVNQASNENSILFIANLKYNLPKLKSDFLQYNNDFDNSIYPVGVVNDYLYMLTNKNSSFFKLIKTPVNNPCEENAEIVIDEKACLLSSCAICGGKNNEKIVTVYLKDVQNEAYLYSLDGKTNIKINLPKNGSIDFSNTRENEEILFFSFTSYTIPNKIIKYNLINNELTDFFVPKIKIDINEFKAEQVFYESKDGRRIPMTIVSKKNILLNGSNPTLLYAYGGFGISLLPKFSVETIAFLEHGGIFACANLRGGLEYGETWHQAGKKMKKQTVFDDFIYAAEFLIKNKYTSSEKLAIQGRSNGGLLIGVVTNQRPDLFSVAIPQVGVMDMLRYQHFTIGWAWVDEYGSSEESKEMFEYLCGYSPVHNIKPDIKYPAILVTTGDHDDRVVPAHSFKYFQALRDNYNGDKPVLIRIDKKAGHGAGKPTAMLIEEFADIYAFIFANIDSTLSC